MLKLGCSLIAYSEIWRSKAALTVLCKRWRRSRGWALARSFHPLKFRMLLLELLLLLRLLRLFLVLLLVLQSQKTKPPVASSDKPISLEKEEGAKEDPSTDLRQKRRKRKVQESFLEEAALGVDSAWEHKVSPIDRAFPAGFNFLAALDSGLTQGSIR
ncbi:hypothetical protein PIB30_063710 [Stylosanthes scabra]|uniref:Uncharacterized protein n=1 Tax=Stylosanthes scabra TaxID=79078 RepID=A0ABU6RLJ6_9FABA|nr:hypothetical protein [Stylosanthes scabra]